MDPVRRDISQSPVLCEVLRTFAGLLAVLYVCLHDKTWLMSLMLQFRLGNSSFPSLGGNFLELAGLTS